MGTEISLSVADVEVCWSKNNMGIDHGPLFQTQDRKRYKSDQVCYDSYDIDDAELAEMEIGFIKKLKRVVPRLELMGVTLDTVRREYELAAKESNETQKFLAEQGLTEPIGSMEFDRFLNLIRSINLKELDGSYDEDFIGKSPAEYGKRFIDEESLCAIPHFDPNDMMVYSEKSLISNFIGFLSPYSALRLLAESQSQGDLDVKWQYGPLVNNGWAEAAMFYPNARREQRFLIVTEGHTDADIINLAIKTLRPEVHDFFYFIDMAEGHPFGGTSNLLKFVKGLVKMDVQNKVLFLYDNDTEGLSAFKKTIKLELPSNMGAVMLPPLTDFCRFETVGPTGVQKMDINGKAVAIECYLDLTRSGLPKTPKVAWSSYKNDVKQYQGALIDKEMYTKDFLKHSSEELLNSGYDLTKLEKVVNTIIDNCIEIAKST